MLQLSSGAAMGGGEVISSEPVSYRKLSMVSTLPSSRSIEKGVERHGLASDKYGPDSRNTNVLFHQREVEVLSV